MVRNYYVYGIVVDGIIRYIGMGKKDRATIQATTSSSNLDVREAIHEGCDVYPIILVSGLSREQAFEKEDQALAKCADEVWNKRVTTASEFVRKRHLDPEFTKRFRASMRRTFLDPVKGEKLRRGLKAGQSSEVHLKLWQDPSYRKARHEGHKDSFTPEWRQKASTAAKNRFKDPARRAAWYAARWGKRQAENPG